MQRSAQAAADPQTKSPDLGCESACRQLSSTTTIAIYYAALLPRRGPHIALHSVCPSVCLSVPLADVVLLFYSRTVLRANIQNRKTSVFAYGPTSRMYFLARAEGRISYGHLGRRTNLLLLLSSKADTQ